VRKVKCARIIVREISTSSLFFIFSIHLEKPIPKMVPRSIPHTIIEIKVKNPVTYVPVDISPVRIIPRIIKKSATAVPSLKRLSHSKIIERRRGAPTALKVARTAIGSVAEIRLPKSIHTRNGISNPANGNNIYNPHPIRSVEISTQKILKVEIETRFFMSSL